VTTMFPLRLCGGKPSVAVTRERRYGPSRLRVNDDDDDDAAAHKIILRFINAMHVHYTLYNLYSMVWRLYRADDVARQLPIIGSII